MTKNDNIKIIKFRYNNIKYHHISNNIRCKVFIEEQGVPSELEYDGQDAYATHYLLFYNDVPIGTARWRITDKGVKLERFAVLREYRNSGIGKTLLESVLDDAIDEKKKIYLHAQEKAVNYYKRAGFEIIGEAFIEAGIKHLKMIYIGV